MKYQQGTFITVPNKDVLNGQSPRAQVLFMWLCHYANTTGECFPSYETLQRNCGMSRRQVMYAMNDLIELGIVEKKAQGVEGRQTTNLYTINIGVQNMHPRGCTTGTPRGAKCAPRTQSIELNPKEPKRTVIPKKERPIRNAEVRADVASVARQLSAV